MRAITIHPGGVRTNIVRNGRMHIDPRGLGRSREEIATEFEAMVRTTPERAAEIIHRGVDAGKAGSSSGRTRTCSTRWLG